MKPLAIYIHIPFCDHKCIYCDFYSIIKTSDKENYLKNLLKEIAFYSDKYAKDRKVISIFFGGGTPSLMEPGYIRQILDAVYDTFNVDEKTEITLETNPGTVELSKLKAFSAKGINRLSIGIQSFNEDELKFLTRIHNSKTAIQTFYEATEAGFVNINIDLIFNLPGQTKEIWKKNLQTAVSLPVTHISAYSLILERGTILNKMVLDKKIKMQDDDFDADLYETTIDYLTDRGFDQYEVSNFAKSGFECVHNKAYWDHTEYLGFGTSAHSFIENRRWWNYSSLNLFNTCVSRNGNGKAGEEILSEQELRDEYIMLSLRSGGLNIENDLNESLSKWLTENSIKIDQLIKSDLMKKNGSVLKLTPKGYAICDEIIAAFNN